MKTPCPPEEQLFAFSEHGLPAEECQAVAAHLETCHACCQVVTRLISEAPRFGEAQLPTPFWEQYDRQFASILEGERARSATVWDYLVKCWQSSIQLPTPVAATAAVILMLLTVSSFAPSTTNGAAVGHEQDYVLMTGVDRATNDYTTIY